MIRMSSRWVEQVACERGFSMSGDGCTVAFCVKCGCGLSVSTDLWLRHEALVAVMSTWQGI